jgi:hypothetical protein
MQHRNLTQACTRVVAGMFIGVLMAAAPGAFADEVSSFNQNASFSTQDGSTPLSAPTSQNSSASTDTGSSARSFLSGMAGKAGDVFQDTLGMALPRRAEEMSRVGEKVSMSNLKPGDLVFFNTMRRTFSHVGIYIGDNKFVHSPSTGSTIRVDDLDDGYWEKRFTGARRVETSYQGSQDLKQRVNAAIGGGNN